MPSRRAPKRRAEPSRAASTGHRAAKPKGGKRAYRQSAATAPTSRRARKSARKPLRPSLSMPVAAGAMALVVAGVGAIVVGPATGGDPGSDGNYPALSGDLNAAGLDTGARVDGFDPSRDIDREVLEQQAEEQAEQRRRALKQLAAKTDKRAKDLKSTQWVLPLAGYRITATFGQPGSMWSSGYHTGLDFAAPVGTPLVAVAHGTITDVTEYDAAYGNWTTLTLDDGTEIWYCHQTTIDVSVGDEVDPGEQIGTVGLTGNVSGPHLHLEVHPDGADEGIDPAGVLEEHGVTP